MLRLRWLGRVPYSEAHALQRGLFRYAKDDYLLLLEHDHVYTLGVRTDPANILVDPHSVGAQMVRADRGGDVTYHGPGQLVGYPILSMPMGSGATPRYVFSVEQVLIDALKTMGVAAGRFDPYPGVWVDVDKSPRKIAAIGVRLTRGRTMHGFALNVDTDMSYFSHIVPCGISEYPVTSLRAEGIDVSMAEVVRAVSQAALKQWSTSDGWESQEVAWREAGISGPQALLDEQRPLSRLEVRLKKAGVNAQDAISVSERKPSWLRAKANMGSEYRHLRGTMRGLDLVTVCEEAGCPNIYECWKEGTATFMINGERCTRFCGFCLVDTGKPLPIDPNEPARVAKAVVAMGLSHAVVTAVARDDLPDGGASGFVETIKLIRASAPGVGVEVLIPDCKGSDKALGSIFAERPDVCNHNLETVARLHRAVRPSAGYARSLSLLAAAKAAGLTTKSGLMLGMGESEEEVLAALADLANVGVDIVTVGQYLRPSRRHLPVLRWWTPQDFDRISQAAQSMGFAHVQASPLTRSSYKAGASAAMAAGDGSEPGSDDTAKQHHALTCQAR